MFVPFPSAWQAQVRRSRVPLKLSVRLFAVIIALAGSFACAGAQACSHPAAPASSGGAAGSGPDMNDSALPENQPLPASHRTRVVSDASELQTAIEAADPGDHIILED